MSDLEQAVDVIGDIESTYFQPTEPVEQTKDRIKERNKVLAGKKLLDEVIQRLEERIAFYDSLKSLETDIEVTPEQHLRQVLANRLTAQNLEQERDYYVGLRDTYKR